jgi:hypothetical protein
MTLDGDISWKWPRAQACYLRKVRPATMASFVGDAHQGQRCCRRLSGSSRTGLPFFFGVANDCFIDVAVAVDLESPHLDRLLPENRN